uniref:Uncharacterized protein n=1 Tax=Timema cristinae TaxID=61476 RepID=A0A7R9CZQ3_TIMCR|nr:unnamed protein product [Timema cristinae]
MSMVGTGDEDSLRCAAILLEEEEDEEDDSCIMSEDQDTLEQDSLEATHTSCATRLDLTDSGLERLPDSLSAFPGLEELLLGRNKLGARSHATPTGGGSNLEILARLPRLRKLLLSSNQLPLFPSALLQLNAVVHLDLSDNNIADLPQDLVELTRDVPPYLRVSRDVPPHLRVSRNVPPYLRVSRNVPPYLRVSRNVPPHLRVSNDILPHPKVFNAPVLPQSGRHKKTPPPYYYSPDHSEHVGALTTLLGDPI